MAGGIKGTTVGRFCQCKGIFTVPGAQATINQDLDLIKSCIEVTRVAARRAAVPDKDGINVGG